VSGEVTIREARVVLRVCLSRYYEDGVGSVAAMSWIWTEYSSACRANSEEIASRIATPALAPSGWVERFAMGAMAKVLVRGK
jgi:hypothetical protein